MKRNILFILPFIPYPLSSGGHQALLNGIISTNDEYNVFLCFRIENTESNRELVNALSAKLGNNAVICPYWEEPLKKTLRMTLGRWKRELKKLLLGKKSQTTYGLEHLMLHQMDMKHPLYYDYIHQLISLKKIDIVQIEMLGEASVIWGIPSTVKTIFVHHEIRYVWYNLMWKGRLLTPFEKACLEHERIMEIALLNQYDAVITLSKNDAVRLMQDGVTAPVFPSVIAVNTPISSLSCNNYHILSFIGPQGHTPNQQAVLWFLENCWETLLGIDSEYHFQIIGRWEEETIEEIIEKYQNVHFEGFVDNLPQTITNTINIVPVHVGSGIRMKILDASSVGIPTVTTTIGVEGIPFNHEEHCLIADSPEDFVHAIVRLKDSKLRERLSKASQEIVKDHFSITALGDSRKAIYKQLLYKS